jgi:YidC/Oxa1 family membrane protein insertase
MEKRLLLAVLLMSAVILLTNHFFPPTPKPGAGSPDSIAAVTQTTGGGAGSAALASAPLASAAPAVVDSTPEVPANVVVVSSELYRIGVSTRGAAVVRAELRQYPSYTEEGRSVQLVPTGSLDFLAHRVVVGQDTIDLSRVAFEPSVASLAIDSASGPRSVRFTYAPSSGVGAEVEYTFSPDRYVVGVSGRLTGLEGRKAVLLTTLGPGLQPHEALDHRSERELAIVSRNAEGDVERTRLTKIEGPDTVVGPLAWAGIKDKYFLAAQVAPPGRTLVGGIARPLPAVEHDYYRGGDTTAVEIPRAELTTSMPVGADGAFAYEAYLGPQEHGQLAMAGQGLEEVTQYAYAWLEPVIRPFAAFILRVVDFFHDRLGLAYGWVLILVGVLMRVILWPLNAKAMRSQMKTAAVAPILQAAREKYKDQPEKQQQEMVRIYKEHGVNPLGGCLPMLIPWPVLITLFFVFQNTIAFRGAEFLWLPDLSLRDPIFLLPVFLVASMFAMQWVSVKASGTEQNSQAKMMMYFMPLMMGVLFFNLPSGLNLYYATTNIASIPQQLLIARERKQAQAALAATGPAAPAAGSRRKRGKP